MHKDVIVELVLSEPFRLARKSQNVLGRVTINRRNNGDSNEST